MCEGTRRTSRAGVKRTVFAEQGRRGREAEGDHRPPADTGCSADGSEDTPQRKPHHRHWVIQLTLALCLLCQDNIKAAKPCHLSQRG